MHLAYNVDIFLEGLIIPTRRLSEHTGIQHKRKTCAD
jgi:hypothetical protein